jgi:ABC-type antimicrobial peptide transport system permease subunit
LRIAVGSIMAAHGAQKLFGWFGGHGLDGTAGFFEQIGLRGTLGAVEDLVHRLGRILLGVCIARWDARRVTAASVASQAVALTVPWLNLAVIFTVVYIASLASTLLPAIRASRIYPAEALRYE